VKISLEDVFSSKVLLLSLAILSKFEGLANAAELEHQIFLITL
jgi:hypothetical protein